MVGNRKEKVARRGEQGLQVPEQGRVGRGGGGMKGAGHCFLTILLDLVRPRERRLFGDFRKNSQPCKRFLGLHKPEGRSLLGIPHLKEQFTAYWIIFLIVMNPLQEGHVCASTHRSE